MVAPEHCRLEIMQVEAKSLCYPQLVSGSPQCNSLWAEDFGPIPLATRCQVESTAHQQTPDSFQSPRTCALSIVVRATEPLLACSLDCFPVQTAPIQHSGVRP